MKVSVVIDAVDRFLSISLVASSIVLANDAASYDGVAAFSTVFFDSMLDALVRNNDDRLLKASVEIDGIGGFFDTSLVAS